MQRRKVWQNPEALPTIPLTILQFRHGESRGDGESSQTQTQEDLQPLHSHSPQVWQHNFSVWVLWCWWWWWLTLLNQKLVTKFLINYKFETDNYERLRAFSLHNQIYTVLNFNLELTMPRETPKSYKKRNFVGRKLLERN